MKTKLLLLILALLGMSQAVAQEYEYVPFVREGVKWVYFYDNPFNAEVLGMADSIQYYSFELKEDTVIDSKSYKPVQLSYLTSTGEDIPQEFVLVVDPAVGHYANRLECIRQLPPLAPHRAACGHRSYG